MAGSVTDIATNSLKIAYPSKAVETMLQEDIVFRTRLKRGLPPGAKFTDGYEIHIGARLASMQNVSQIPDSGEFPTPKDSIDRKFVFKPTIFAGDYPISGLVRKVASSNVAGFNGGESRRRPEEVMNDLGKFIESTYVGTTGDGIRGYVEADGANTITMKNPWAGRLIPENSLISVRDAAGGSIRDSLDARTVTDYDNDTRILTYSGANQTAVANDPVYIIPNAGLTGATLAAMHANGLRGQVDDGTNLTLLHTLDRTAAGNKKLKSLRLGDGGERRNITETLLLNAAHETARRSKKHPSTLIMSEGQCEKYIEHVAPQKRFPAVGRQRSSKSTGYMLSELSFTSPYGEMDFMLSFDCLPGEVYGVSWDAFFLYQAADAEWLSGHEAQNLFMTPGTSAYKFAYTAYCVTVENWGTDYPSAHFVAADLKDRNLGD